MFGLMLTAIAAPGCATRYYRISEQYLFESKDGESEVFLAVMLPKSCHYQQVKDLEVAWNGPVQMEDRGFVDVARLHGKVAARGKAEATITYSVILSSTKARHDDPVEPGDLQPQRDIESDHPTIVEKARQLAPGRTRKDVRRIHAFVRSHLSAPKGDWVGGSGSALKAYETGIGVCGQRANLCVALCRAAGIPARSVGGLSLIRPLWAGTSCSRSGLHHPGVAHAWAEFRTDAGWESVDPSSPLFNAHGFLLYYGEKDAEQEVHAELYKWARANGEGVAGGIGAMTAPYKFAASAEPKCVVVTPCATVERLWSAP